MSPRFTGTHRLRGLDDLQAALDLSSPNLVNSVLFPGGATIAVETNESTGQPRLPDADEINALGITIEMRHLLLGYATRPQADGQVMRVIVTSLAERINSLKSLADACDEKFCTLTYRGMRLRQLADQLTALVTQLANAYGQTRSLLPTETSAAA